MIKKLTLYVPRVININFLPIISTQSRVKVMRIHKIITFRKIL